jgi:endonuclease G
MSDSKKWKGYDSKFLSGFDVSIPKMTAAQKKDVAMNSETKGEVLPFIYYSSVQSKSRRMPFFTACNVNRESWLQVGREGAFTIDKRLTKDEQLSTTIYKQLNKKHSESNKKVDKGHLTKREDVQWDPKKNAGNATKAAKATFYYTNACPQHHELNNEIWKALEGSVLVRGRSRKPLKAIVFTGPIFNSSDPFLVFPKGVEHEIKCPIRFWKVIYYVNDKKELRCAAFIMSHKLLMERDGYFQSKLAMRGLELVEEEEGKPFLMFEENEKYQIKLSLLQKLTGFKFTKAKEGLTKEQYSKLSIKPTRNLRGSGLIAESTMSLEIEGLVL